MKRILFFLLLSFLCASASWAQSSVTRSPEAAEQHQLLLTELAKQNYEKAIAAGEKELLLLRQQPETTDSLQIETFPSLGRAYFKLGQVDRAISMNLEGIALCLKNKEEDTNRLAVMYDNLAFYYTFRKQYAEALNCSKKAVAIYYKLLPNNEDMAITLMHAAESSYNLDQYADAVLYEEHACNLYAEVFGEHNDTYLEELDYLIKYYKANGQDEKASETEELQKRLKEEQKMGYIPMAADLSTAEKCALHDEDAYFASIYFTNHRVTADSMIFVGKYIFNYVLNSDRVHAISGNEEAKWMKDKNAFPFLIAYFSGFVIHQLEEPEKEASLTSYTFAISNMLNFYLRNKDLLGEVPALEEYLKLYNKSLEKMMKKIEKDYEAQQKAQTKRMDVVEDGDKLIIN